MQSRKHSAIETFLNTSSGFIVSWLTWIVIAPYFGLERNPAEATVITCIFTSISLIRSYFWRRLFNKYCKF